ncbi:MAG: zinc finger Ran-binding domain-containing family 2 protein [Lachnospiraceae bacterium]|nr:zinc finger Ran-binding domain-containing family 2 protein [Lachnospiraceae bacterium]
MNKEAALRSCKITSGILIAFAFLLLASAILPFAKFSLDKFKSSDKYKNQVSLIERLRESGETDSVYYSYLGINLEEKSNELKEWENTVSNLPDLNMFSYGYEFMGIGTGIFAILALVYALRWKSAGMCVLGLLNSLLVMGMNGLQKFLRLSLTYSSNIDNVLRYASWNSGIGYYTLTICGPGLFIFSIVMLANRGTYLRFVSSEDAAKKAMTYSSPSADGNSQKQNPYMSENANENKWRCEACGFMNEADSWFCPKCGSKKPTYVFR